VVVDKCLRFPAFPAVRFNPSKPPDSTQHHRYQTTSFVVVWRQFHAFFTTTTC
jgi:hypothetical protein